MPVPEDEGTGVVLPVGDRDAVVLAADGVALDGWGTVRADPAPGALAAVADAAGVVAEGLSLPGRLGAPGVPRPGTGSPEAPDGTTGPRPGPHGTAAPGRTLPGWRCTR